MFAIGNVLQYIADNRHMFGGNAPFIVARAMKMAQNGLFSGSAADEIFGSSEITMAQAFMAQITVDIRHMALFVRGPNIDLSLLLAALFSERDIQELGQQLDAQGTENLSTLPQAIGTFLKAKGVGWIDEWIQIQVEVVPETE